MGAVCLGLEVPPGPRLDIRQDGWALVGLSAGIGGGGRYLLLQVGEGSERLRPEGPSAGLPGEGGLGAAVSVPGQGGAHLPLPAAQQLCPVQVRLHQTQAGHHRGRGCHSPGRHGALSPPGGPALHLTLVSMYRHWLGSPQKNIFDIII